jgi:hypothetical protein
MIHGWVERTRRAAAWLAALATCGWASAPEHDAAVRAAEESHARGDAEGVYAAAERARGVAEPVPLADLRAKILDIDQVLLEYLVGEGATFIALVSQDRCRSARVDVGADSLAALVDTLNAQIEAGEREPGASKTLHALLIAPLAAEIPPDARLVFVPDAPAGRFPFAALRDGESFLVERHPISSARGSATALPTERVELESFPVAVGSIVPKEGFASPGVHEVAPELSSWDRTLPADVGIARAQRAAIARGAPPREWAVVVPTGRMRAPRRPSGEFPGWLVPIGMAAGGATLWLALRRVPRVAS